MERVRAFDAKVSAAVGEKLPREIAALAEEYRPDYSTVREHFLCAHHEGFGPRWCPGIQRRADVVGKRLETYAADFAAVIRQAEEGYREMVRLDGDVCLIMAAAAQAAVRFVVDLADVFGIDVTTLTDWQEVPLIGAGQAFLVGSDPFTLRRDGLSNPMHVFRPAEDILVGPPVVKTLPADLEREVTTVGLLEEDEWEACVIHRYAQSHPRIAIGQQAPIEVSVPPAYPWGFRFLDIRKYRENNNGFISKEWHLVGSFFRDRRQICKGGGLRDREPQVFEIGSRGALRIGEYDEFVTPAPRYRRSSSTEASLSHRR